MRTARQRPAPPAKAKRLVSEVLPIAFAAVELLSPACERLIIAGSIRRGIQYVGDVEILAIPKFETRPVPDLFSSATESVNLLDELTLQLRADGVLQDRPDKNGRPAWGSKFKRARFQDFPLDLFVCLDPMQWGALCVIRTGPAGYSHQLVTPKGRKFKEYGTDRWRTGQMPEDMCEHDYRLWKLDEHGKRTEAIPTPTEADYFKALGLEYVKPEDRR